MLHRIKIDSSDATNHLLFSWKEVPASHRVSLVSLRIAFKNSYEYSKFYCHNWWLENIRAWIRLPWIQTLHDLVLFADQIFEKLLLNLRCNPFHILQYVGQSQNAVLSFTNRGRQLCLPPSVPNYHVYFPAAKGLNHSADEGYCRLFTYIRC